MKALGRLNDLLSRVAEVGRSLTLVSGAAPSSLDIRCEELLSGRGEATGLAVAREILDRYAKLDREEKRAFFQMLHDRFGVDRELLEKAIREVQTTSDDAAARDLHFACEPRSQELIRRLNRAPGGTEALVAMRADLLKIIRDVPELKPLDNDFRHLFGSWFNRGFLELRSINWSTPAEVLEKVIAYEAVHAIHGWDDLRRRVAAPDRRLYAFFHPALRNDPLIFVEVALTCDIPGAISPILAEGRSVLKPQAATTAVFYSISNCQAGLRGISFGNFLIKQVVEELRREFEGLTTFVTLSPVPGLRRWATSEAAKTDGMLSAAQVKAIQALNSAEGTIDIPSMEAATEMLAGIAARYLVEARSPGGGAIDPVARFHLGNGARLERIDVGGDQSSRGLDNSWGVMVNYLYDLGNIERNHEAYANAGEVICSPAVRRLLKSR